MAAIVPSNSLNVPETKLSSVHKLVFSKSYKNDKFQTFTDVVSQFLDDSSLNCSEGKVSQKLAFRQCYS
jgi:hypothetical protein